MKNSNLILPAGSHWPSLTTPDTLSLQIRAASAANTAAFSQVFRGSNQQYIKQFEGVVVGSNWGNRRPVVQFGANRAQSEPSWRRDKRTQIKGMIIWGKSRKAGTEESARGMCISGNRNLQYPVCFATQWYSWLSDSVMLIGVGNIENHVMYLSFLHRHFGSSSEFWYVIPVGRFCGSRPGRECSRQVMEKAVGGISRILKDWLPRVLHDWNKCETTIDDGWNSVQKRLWSVSRSFNYFPIPDARGSPISGELNMICGSSSFRTTSL